MRSKLHAIAERFVREAGKNLQQYSFVFPNHRAGLFFRKYIAQYVEGPIFAPRVMTINECFAALSDLHVADSLTLLLRLYSEYKKLQKDAEDLDRFIYWGKMMLADFSEIDNHLVPHVEALFASIRDLHAIEERFGYLTDNQRMALSQFWNEFSASSMHHPDAVLHEKFLSTWDVLFPLYQALRSRLLEEGLAYEGMLHREVLENWDAIDEARFQKHYVFIGFNALTKSERELMLRLQAMGKADFYFDYDSPYLHDAQNRASMFMQENLSLFHSKYDVACEEETLKKADIHLLCVSSTVGEVHEVHRILEKTIPEGGDDLTRTVVVLPDEELLIPLLNAIPTKVDKINVTMGYPLRGTPLYQVVAYPEQELPVMPSTPEAFVEQMRACILAKRNENNSEGIYQILKVLDRLASALEQYREISLTVSDMQQLLKMLTLESTIPYVGEPLDGLQVMGVLETRALDFDNVIITGFNDELYPGRTSGGSFIPYTLRCGFEMPTPDRQNAIFAYNFYRMLSYAKHVWLISNSSVDEQHSGEISRYYYQLKWQYGIDVQKSVVTQTLVMPEQGESKHIEKDQRLQSIEDLSATKLACYLRCPKQFYYKYIEKLKEPAADETVSASEMTVGNVLHMVMEKLYAPYVGKNVTSTDVKSLLEWVEDMKNWDSLHTLEALHGDQLANRVVRSYVESILLFDYQQTPFQYLAAEEKLSASLKGRKIYGYADRIDMKKDTVRVVDYKTGGTDLVYASMKDVFGGEMAIEDGMYIPRKKGKSQLLQTMLYCWLMSESKRISGDQRLSPHVYAARRLGDVNTITYMHTSADEEVVYDDALKEEFVNELEALVDEMFDMTIPFVPTTEQHSCTHCAFAQLCKT